jgi:hypothetical protein
VNIGTVDISSDSDESAGEELVDLVTPELDLSVLSEEDEGEGETDSDDI